MKPRTIFIRNLTQEERDKLDNLKTSFDIKTDTKAALKAIEMFHYMIMRVKQLESQIEQLKEENACVYFIDQAMKKLGYIKKLEND